MTNEEFKNLKEFDKIYFYSRNTGLLEVSYSSESKASNIKMFELNKDVAILKWYLKEKKDTIDKIEKDNAEIKKKTKYLENLELDFEHLKLKYPDEFL